MHKGIGHLQEEKLKTKACERLSEAHLSFPTSIAKVQTYSQLLKMKEMILQNKIESEVSNHY